MKNTLWIICGTALCAALAAQAQDFGDVPYVQTPQNVVDKILDVARVTAKDFVIDLGSGDGRIVITAAKKHGARGFGVDLDPRLVALANRRAAQAGVADRAKFYAQDLFETDLSKATVITMYLLPEVNLMLRAKLLKTLDPGTRIVSHDWDMGDWQPDEEHVVDAPNKPVGRDKKSRILYWVIPAQASGVWMWRQGEGGAARDVVLDVNQNYQKIEGTVTSGGAKARMEDAKLLGTHVSFAYTMPSAGEPVRYAYSGTIVSNEIDGEVEITRGQAKTKAKWTAARTEIRLPKHFTAPPPDLHKFEFGTQ
jgi:hypothetical protein